MDYKYKLFNLYWLWSDTLWRHTSTGSCVSGEGSLIKPADNGFSTGSPTWMSSFCHFRSIHACFVWSKVENNLLLVDLHVCLCLLNAFNSMNTWPHTQTWRSAFWDCCIPDFASWGLAPEGPRAVLFAVKREKAQGPGLLDSNSRLRESD